jgi:hypothetical protein
VGSVKRVEARKTVLHAVERIEDPSHERLPGSQTHEWWILFHNRPSELHFIEKLSSRQEKEKGTAVLIRSQHQDETGPLWEGRPGIHPGSPALHFPALPPKSGGIILLFLYCFSFDFPILSIIFHYF